MEVSVCKQKHEDLASPIKLYHNTCYIMVRKIIKNLKTKHVPNQFIYYGAITQKLRAASSEETL